MLDPDSLKPLKVPRPRFYSGSLFFWLWAGHFDTRWASHLVVSLIQSEIKNPNPGRSQQLVVGLPASLPKGRWERGPSRLDVSQAEKTGAGDRQPGVPFGRPCQLGQDWQVWVLLEGVFSPSETDWGAWQGGGVSEEWFLRAESKAGFRRGRAPPIVRAPVKLAVISPRGAALGVPAPQALLIPNPSAPRPPWRSPLGTPRHTPTPRLRPAGLSAAPGAQGPTTERRLVETMKGDVLEGKLCGWLGAPAGERRLQRLPRFLSLFRFSWQILWGGQTTRCWDSPPRF